MSDSERTPQRTARISSERFDTELAAVWYAANYYYETSYRRDREYIGVVFRDENWKFGLTVRGDGSHSESKIRIGDVPLGTIPTAVWHTHLPASAGNASDAAKIITWIISSFDLGWDEFSGNDTKLSDDASTGEPRALGAPHTDLPGDGDGDQEVPRATSGRTGVVQAGAESHAPARRRPLGLRGSKRWEGSRDEPGGSRAVLGARRESRRRIYQMTSLALRSSRSRPLRPSHSE